MSDIWRNQQFYGLIALTIYFCFLFSKRYGKLVATALCYTLLSAVYLFMNPNPLYAPQELQGFLDSSSAKSFIKNYAHSGQTPRDLYYIPQEALNKELRSRHGT